MKLVLSSSLRAVATRAALIPFVLACFATTGAATSQQPTSPTDRMNGKGGFDMAYIAPCEFTMGVDDGSGYQFHSHRVTLSGYWLSKTPITVKQFRAYTTAQDIPFDWHARQPDWGWRDNDPMVNVTWFEAEDYCKWAGGRLPTEAQWEHATRGDDDSFFPWGDKWQSGDLWSSIGRQGDSGGTASVVRTNHIFKNAYGLTDLIGNVKEWCFDAYGLVDDQDKPVKDPDGPSHSPTGPREGDNMALRGVSWYSMISAADGSQIDNATVSASAAYHREPLAASNFRNTVGFRFAMAAGK